MRPPQSNFRFQRESNFSQKNWGRFRVPNSESHTSITAIAPEVREVPEVHRVRRREHHRVRHHRDQHHPPRRVRRRRHHRHAEEQQLHPGSKEEHL